LTQPNPVPPSLPLSLLVLPFPPSLQPHPSTLTHRVAPVGLTAGRAATPQPRAPEGRRERQAELLAPVRPRRAVLGVGRRTRTHLHFPPPGRIRMRCLSVCRRCRRRAPTTVTRQRSTRWAAHRPRQPRGPHRRRRSAAAAEGGKERTIQARYRGENGARMGCFSRGMRCRMDGRASE